MQKRGFPAAGILALLVGATFLLTLIVKQIYRQIDIIVRRRHGSVRSSMIPTYHEEPLRIRTCTTCSARNEDENRFPGKNLLENVQIDHHAVLIKSVQWRNR